MTHEPLTPAQVEMLTELIEERQARFKTNILDAISTAITAAIEPLQQQIDQLRTQLATMQESLYILDNAAVKNGSRITLRSSSGKLISAQNGGPLTDGTPFEFESRSAVGDWEIYQIERIQ